MRIREGIKYGFDDVLLVPQRSSAQSRLDVQITREFHFAHSNRVITCVPIIAANMSATGTFAMAEAFGEYGMMVALHKYYRIDEIVKFLSEHESLKNLVFVTAGISKDDFYKVRAIDAIANIGLINIDVANGYMNGFGDVIKSYRDDNPDAVIMAGTVATPNMAEELILDGADIVRVGIANGGMCTTKYKTGVGYPQLSCVDECSFAAHGKPNGHICSDGGCKQAGDVCKAFAAGADFVMIGSMFSGTDQCDAEWEYGADGKKESMRFFGMSSKEAQEEFNGGLPEYRASEGTVKQIPYKGDVSLVVQDILGGLRSCCSYVGATKLKDLPKCAEFVRVS